MAGIDYTIPGQIKSIQLDSPMNAMAQAMQLRNMQESSEMNALKRQEYARGVEQKNKLARIYADTSLKPGSEEQLLRIQQEVPEEYESAATRALQRESILSQKEQRAAEAEKRQFESEKLKTQLSREKIETAIADITSFDTVGAVLSDINRKVESGELQQDQADKIIAGMPNTDAEIPAWQIRTVRSLLSAKDRLADVRAEKKDVREEQRLSNEEARLKLEGQRIEEQTRHANAMEENARKGADRAEADLKERIRHNEAMERLRRAEINKPSAGENPNKVAHTSTDDQGNVTFYNAFGQKIRTETNAGKRSPQLVKQEQAEKNLSRDIERTSAELKEITKDGGLIDQSTGSGAGRLVDFGARFIGEATPGDIAASSLAPIADMVLKMVPRFEGPQSEKDVKSYELAAGQLANPSLPNKIRKEAGKTILRLMEERKNQFTTRDMDMSPNERKAAPPPPAGFVPDKK